MKTKVITLLIIISSSITFAQETDLEQVKAEINRAVSIEKIAFQNGDCDTVLALMDDNITFLANGKKAPSKEIIAKFCKMIKRPFKKPILDVLDTYPLNNDTAYTVRTLEYPKSKTTKMQEFVTKIWKKIDGQWKITHLHSTVKEISNN